MGGRGASSGMSDRGNPYGSQWHDILLPNGEPLVAGNMKFIEGNPKPREEPLETMTRGRIYAEIGKKGDVVRLHFYGDDGRRTKRIDTDSHDGIMPHVQEGYMEAELTRALTAGERELLAEARRIWDAYRSGTSYNGITP